MKWLNDLLSSPYKAVGGIIHFAEDEYGKLLVIEEIDRRVLNFDSPFEQSSMDLSHPYKLVHNYTQMMVLVLAFNQPFKATILGLGGGSLLRTLHHVLPDCTFTVVELRQKVVDVALEYFEIPNDDRVNILVEDGLNSLRNSPSDSTDIIFSDMYDAYNMVSEQVQQEFLMHCSRTLSSHGWLVMNLHKLPDDNTAFSALLLSIFPVVYISCNTTNIILLLSNAPPSQIKLNLEVVDILERMLQQKFKILLPRMKPAHNEYNEVN